MSGRKPVRKPAGEHRDGAAAAARGTGRGGTGGRATAARATLARDTLLLTGLLAVIAGLLVLLIVLLPETLGEPGRTDAARGRESDPAVGTVIPADRPPSGTAPGTPVTSAPEPLSPDRPPEPPAPADPAAVDTPARGEGAGPGPGPDGDAPGAAVAADRPWWLPAEPRPASSRGVLALILDDAGYTLDNLDRFLSVPVPLAVAVLPQLDYSVAAALLAASYGQEIMLHLPMEAVNGADPGPGAVGATLTEEEIQRTVLENLRSVPGAVGANNHMGSLASQDARVLAAVMRALDERELFYVDSRTTAASVADTVAREVGLPFAERRVFLDNLRDRDSILEALAGALELVQDEAVVVMIGHVTAPALAEVLHEAAPILLAHGYRFARVSELVRPLAVAEGDHAGPGN